MTPELRQSIATRARGLQLRMPPGMTLDVVPVATEAKSLFEERADELRSRWLALAIAGRGCGWTVKRRLQSRLSEGADWLLKSGDDEVILEVGGTDEGDLEALHKRKVHQARAAAWPEGTVRAACVVRFLEPKVLFWSSDGPG